MCWWLLGPMWGFWWMFPLMAIAFMIVVMLIMSRRMRGGMGMCGAMGSSETDALRREIGELRQELARSKKKPQEVP